MNIDSMIQGNPQALVTSYNGVLVADSLEVADRFGKAHKNVVRDIENLMDGIEANRLNFEPIAEKEYFIPDFYTDKRNREQKRYKLTRDGFSLLVMGFTGPAALHWKQTYGRELKRRELRQRERLELLINREDYDSADRPHRAAVYHELSTLFWAAYYNKDGSRCRLATEGRCFTDVYGITWILRYDGRYPNGNTIFKLCAVVRGRMLDTNFTN